MRELNMLRKLIEKYKEKRVRLLSEYQEYYKGIDTIRNEYLRLFENKDIFIDPEIINTWTEKREKFVEESDNRSLKRFKKIANYKKTQRIKVDLISQLKNIESHISNHNNRLAQKKINYAYELVGMVEGRKLDNQQMQSIVKESHNQLVIAGAGTGKTTTVIGKIKYLLKTRKYKADQILALSFTNVSANELSERIFAETSEHINAWTFHKLGLDIIRKSSQSIPNITKIDLRKFIKDHLLQYMKYDVYLQLLNAYVLSNRVITRSEFEFITQNEYEEYLKLNPPTTLKNEVVKSYGEMEIANFFYQNGIDYIYEHPYKATISEDGDVTYKPDFYLPKYGIYVEYFGIDRNYQVPSYFKSSNTMSASEKYLASMEWKRKLHQRNNTIMIESFAYEKFENNLQEHLKHHLEVNGVQFSPKSATEMWEKLAGDGETVIDGIVEVMEMVINLVKSNNYSFDDLKNLNKGSKNEAMNTLLITLSEPFFNEYSKVLKEKNEIDFNDMINLATHYVNVGKYKNPYQFVIVDEYQDISKSRFLLLKALRGSRDYDVFCVGDDWQSIYRFAGSDIGLILDFDKHWGYAIQDKIETTYRFNQNLIDISGRFIMENPAQLKKSLKANGVPNSYALAEVNGYTVVNAVNFMVEKLKELPKGSSVFFIGRYSHDANVLKNESINYRFNNQTKNVDVFVKGRNDLRMQFLTAHRSKGLQADYVVIINNKNGILGFPSKIVDHPILELLLHNYEMYPSAEERRLYYVALTRAKKKVILLTIKDQMSEFALSLKNKYSHEITQERYSCPHCTGKLVRKKGPHGEFYGCTNYRNQGCRFTKKILSS